MNAPNFHKWLLVGIAAVSIFILPSFASANSRLALVIGMSRYEHVNSLENAAGDAEAVGQTLEKLGFDVTLALNLPLDALVKAINRFSFESETAEIALVYYAGHGVEVDGQNYLIPVDLRFNSVREMNGSAITVNNLLNAVRNARLLRVVILDSCRNNPFLNLPQNVINASATEEVELRQGGLAPPSPHQGTLVVYAAKAGEVAFDGADGHSPFARALIEQLPSSGTEIGMMFRKVRDAVMAETGNMQEPHFYGSLSSVPYFLASGDSLNVASLTDRRQAWGSLAPAQEVQLASLASQGNTRALMGLGYIALNPQGSKFNPDQAFKYFSEAAENGDNEAMFELGKLYEKGIGTNQDFSKALELFQKSADLGFADAINDLGFLYFQGAKGLKRDPEKAVSLFLKAADLRHPQAMYNTAALIDDGLIEGKGPEDAARYLYDSLRAGIAEVLEQLSERPNQFKPATRKALQVVLKENGFYKGSIDGAFGRGTKRAMETAYHGTAELSGE